MVSPLWIALNSSLSLCSISVHVDGPTLRIKQYTADRRGSALSSSDARGTPGSTPMAGEGRLSLGSLSLGGLDTSILSEPSTPVLPDLGPRRWCTAHDVPVLGIGRTKEVLDVHMSSHLFS